MKLSKIFFTIIAVYFWGVVLGYITNSILWMIPMILVSAFVLVFVGEDEE